MRLETLRLKNFRGYEDQIFHLHPEFNLIIGENGSGKTSILEGAAVAIGSWLLGFPGLDSRSIRKKDVRVIVDDAGKIFPQYPARVEATGYLQDNKPCQWSRSVANMGGRTTQIEANDLKKIASDMKDAAFKRHPEILPLIRYFGTGRLWESVRNSEANNLAKYKGMQPAELAKYSYKIDRVLFDDTFSSPFYGYKMSVDRRCNSDDLIRWMASERSIELDEEKKSSALRLVYQAIENMMPEIKALHYSMKLKTLVLHFKDEQRRTFQELSDGYRNIVAMTADLAIKTAMLNPHLGDKALELTPGVVLIDELDLHLHPRWQRRVIEDLRRTFPKVQFICTTHSPFLIQSLRSGEELIVLDGQPTAQVDNMPIDKIAQGLMGVDNTETSARYDEMKSVAKKYLAQLEQGIGIPSEKLSDFLEELAKPIAPYANNPAFQAFLEMKRAVKLGVE